MADQSLRDRMGRWLVIVSITAGILYPLLGARLGLGGEVALKGVAVGALAIAAFQGDGPYRKWLGAIMAAGAVGDVLLNIPGAFFVGAGAFAIGHVIAMAFYSQLRRGILTLGDKVFAAALIGFGLAMPTLVLPAGQPVGALMLYSVLLCGMAAAAWISRFPRRWAAAGALLFVASDTFLVMRMGGTLVGGGFVHGLIVWYSYYLGQLMIFTGVRRGLDQRQGADWARG
ncbi:lysoplasmalogenase [Sandarakinorhabdus glacialis]|nr:lysoplasmalogenase [Polymorphobacter glacialis]